MAGKPVVTENSRGREGNVETAARILTLSRFPSAAAWIEFNKGKRHLL